MEIQLQAALEQLQALFADTKSRGNKAQWKNYFLSDDFLAVQFFEPFAEEMMSFLKHQSYMPYEELPPAFLLELVVAYALDPFISEQECIIDAAVLYEKDGEDNAEITQWERALANSRRIAAQIWNDQNDFWRIERGGRTIKKWEYRLRSKAFEDYIGVCSDYEAGKYEGNKWDDRPFSRGCWCYIQTGACKKTAYGTFIRNECILRLYAYFLRTRKMPLSVCVWLYQTYDLSGIAGKSYESSYEGIRQALLSQYPSLASAAEEAQAEEEKYREWKSRLYDLEQKYKYDGWAVKPKIMHNYCTYALSKPTVTEQEQKEWQDILSDPVFCRHKYDDILLRDIEYHWLGGNATLGMAEAFYNEYLGCERKNPKITAMLEHLTAKISYFERISEYLCWEPYPYICEMNTKEFWYYYLMTAFNGRYIETEHDPENDSFIEAAMIRNGRKYLSAYIETIYRPSMEWRRRFVGSDKTGQIEKPRNTILKVDEDNEIRIEYHLHYIQYFWNGTPWMGVVLTFQELLEYAGQAGMEDRFILLLALTYIEEEEQEIARIEIAKRLKALPIDAQCIDFTAACLVHENLPECFPQSVYYAENMTTCYRADIYENGIEFSRYTPMGWNLNGLKQEERMRLAIYGISSVQSSGRIKKKIAVQGMTNLEKAEQIYALLKENNCGIAACQEAMPDEGKLLPAVREFLKEGGCLAENCVMLCYGNQDSILFEKPLYTGLYGSKAEAQGEYAISSKEKNQMVGWLFLDWDWGKAVFSIGESGTFYFHKSLAKKAQAHSLPEIIAARIRLEDVTAVYVTEKPPFLPAPAKPVADVSGLADKMSCPW